MTVPSALRSDPYNILPTFYQPLEGNGEYQKNFNKKILNLCDNKKVKYIELSFEKTSLMLKMKKHFKQLSRFFRSKPIDFSDAFELACI